jgi:bifunctional DNase/RNase/DNA-binding transcriptional MerR regulator
MDADDKRWKVGELAAATGLTVRALHHYDQLGLLVPCQRTGGGHRLYAEEDVRRLYRILALRRLGFPLDEIASLLDEGGLSLAETVRRHLERVERDLAHQRRLRRHLVHILDALDRFLEPSITEFIDALEVMAMIEMSLEDVFVPVFGENDEGETGGFHDHGQPAMLLKELEGERVLAIFIGWPEGNTLALELAGKARPRPMAPDLTARLVEASGALIERVSVSSLRENTFYATVTLSAGGESHEIDARPSDALNLAARVSAPIFVDAQVMDEWAVPSRANVVSRLTECGGPHQEAMGKPTAPNEWRSLLPLIGTPPSLG